MSLHKEDHVAGCREVVWGGSLVATKAILNDGHTANALRVITQLPAQLLEEAPVDVKDDLHVPRQQLLY